MNERVRFALLLVFVGSFFVRRVASHAYLATVEGAVYQMTGRQEDNVWVYLVALGKIATWGSGGTLLVYLLWRLASLL